MSSTPRHTVEAEKFNLAVTISLNFMLNQIIHLQSIGKKKLKMATPHILDIITKVDSLLCNIMMARCKKDLAIRKNIEIKSFISRNSNTSLVTFDGLKLLRQLMVFLH